MTENEIIKKKSILKLISNKININQNNRDKKKQIKTTKEDAIEYIFQFYTIIQIKKINRKNKNQIRRKHKFNGCCEILKG
jgi:hypothetical protein